MGRLTELYDRRFVNVNVNVIVAGVLAMGITVGVMHSAGQLGLDTEGETDKYLVTGLTFVVDLIADVAVYYLLHWFANHMPRKIARARSPRYADLSFVRDATLVQFERAVLSPLLYLIALGTQHALLRYDYSIAGATALGFTLGIATTRILHTLYMYRMEARSRVRSADRVVEMAAKAGVDILHPAPAPEAAPIPGAERIERVGDAAAPRAVASADRAAR